MGSSGRGGLLLASIPARVEESCKALPAAGLPGGAPSAKAQTISGSSFGKGRARPEGGSPQCQRWEAVSPACSGQPGRGGSIVSRGARDQVNRLGRPDGPHRPAHRPARNREARFARTPASPPHAERHTRGRRAGRNGRQPEHCLSSAWWPSRPKTDQVEVHPSPSGARGGMDRPSARRRVLRCALFCSPASPSRGFCEP